MVLRKAYISLSLVFVYGLGLTHELVPHCHDQGAVAGSATEQSGLHHHHGHHADATPSNHKDIIHLGHRDHGLLDLLICLISETQHPSSANDLCFCTAVQVRSSHGQWVVKLTGVAISPATLVLGELLRKDKEHAMSRPAFTDNDIVLSSPLRGPPVV